MTDYQSLLNQAQYEAVTYIDGPSVIVAGAGSGKTRVLTYKISYLIEMGYPAASILALTFTNKAAGEMKERIAQVVGEKYAHYLWMGTFHSIFSKILRMEAQLIGYTRDYTIYDTSDSKSLIKSIIKELALDEKIYTVKVVMGRISYAKNHLITPTDYMKNVELLGDDNQQRRARLIDVYRVYCERLKRSNAMDFDDLLLNTYLLFRDNPEVLARYQSRFNFILVDEYQDTNVAQHAIMKQLAAVHRKICVVGDDAQSIYSFRGANIDNMLGFQRSFPGAQLFKLEQNYRSTQMIVNAANSLIQNNKHQIPKNVYSEREEGAKINVMSCISDIEESNKVVKYIKKLTAKSGDYYNVAVLYRVNSQSRSLENILMKEGVPYKVYGGLSFYQRREIKDVLAYLRLCTNKYDEEAFKRVINYPSRKIGEVTVKQVFECARTYSISALEATQCPELLGFTGARLKAIEGFGKLIADFTAASTIVDAYTLTEMVIERSGIKSDLSDDGDPDNADRRDNVEELLTAIHEFCEEKVNQGSEEVSVVDFLSEVSLLTDQDSDKEEDYNKVTLMTVHASKGLEYKHLFIVGMEEELFPLGMCLDDSEVEEERRLCYVAITRAKDTCVISYAKSRFRNGNYTYGAPSRFLGEIDEDYIRLPEMFVPNNLRHSSPLNVGNTNCTAPRPVAPNAVFRPIRATASTPTSSTTSSKDQFNVGDTVMHSTFGKGVVIALEGDAANRKAKINFGGSERTLLLKYAKLTKL